MQRTTGVLIQRCNYSTELESTRQPKLLSHTSCNKPIRVQMCTPLLQHVHVPEPQALWPGLLLKAPGPADPHQRSAATAAHLQYITIKAETTSSVTEKHVGPSYLHQISSCDIARTVAATGYPVTDDRAARNARMIIAECLPGPDECVLMDATFFSRWAACAACAWACPCASARAASFSAWARVAAWASECA